MLDCAQRVRMPLTMVSTCSAVSRPPALCANAGIAVPGTPSVITRRIVASSAMARYSGSAKLNASPRVSSRSLSDLAAPSDQRERAIEETPAAGPSSLSDLAAPSDQRERAIEETPAAGPTPWHAAQLRA